MGLRIIRGRRSAQLSEHIYQRIGGLVKQKAYLMVPEQFTLGAEEGLIKSNHLQGLLGVEVLSPKRLGMRVLKETGGLNKLYMDRQGRKILLQKALVGTDLSIYQGSINKAGFLEKMMALISELKENELTPEDFLKIDQSLEVGILKQKLNDIRLIYENYQALLGQDRLDDEDLQQIFCQKIKDADFLKEAIIFIDGFQNFSRQDYRLLEKLLATAKDLVIALAVDTNCRDAEVFDLTAQTLDQLKKIAWDQQSSFHLESLGENKSAGGEIDFLEKNLFAYPPQSFGGKIKNIHLIQNQTVWDEVTNTAGEMLSLIRDRKCTYGDMVVLAGDLDLYGSIIKGVFTQYQIPFFLDELRPVGDNHLIEAVMTALEAVLGNYPRDELLAYLKTGFSPVAIDEGRDLENYSLEFGIRGQQWARPFTKSSQNPALDLDKLNQVRAALINPLVDLKASLKKARTCRQISRTIYEFLVATRVPQTLDNFIETLSAEKDYQVLEAYDQIWNILMKVFDQLVETMGEDEVSLGEYIRLFKAGISDYQLGLIPPQGDYVNITDLRRSRSQAFSVLFVLGFNEGKIPQTGSEPNLITDAERQLLKNHHFHLQNNLAFQMEQERFLIYDVLTRPQTSLFINWALSDLEGNSLPPSHLLARFFTIFPQIAIESKIGAEEDFDWNQINRPDLTLWKLINYQKEAANKPPPRSKDLVWGAVKDWLEHSPYADQYQNGLKALDYQGMEGQLTPAQAEKLYGKKMRTSVTRLEKFVQCPFSHYVKYGLKPGDRLSYEVSPPEIGNLLHAVVDGFFKQVETKNLDLEKLDEEKRAQIIKDLMSKFLPQIKNNVFNSRAAYQYLGKKIERIGRRSIDQIIRQLKAGKFLPEQREFPFEKPVEYFRDVKIQGKIDRLDIYRRQGQTWIKIIDYKTGNKTLNYEDIYFGLSLQLVVYLDGAMTVLNEENILPGGIFYFQVDDPILRMDLEIDPATFNDKLERELNKAFRLKGLVCDDQDLIQAMDEKRDRRNSDILPLYTGETLVSPEEFKDLIRYVRELVADQIKRIYGGEIKARPFQKDSLNACSYCDYRGICQFDELITKDGYVKVNKSMKKEEFFKLIKENQEIDDEKLD